MNYFTSERAAREWADSYGLPYAYSIVPAEGGLCFVRWDYRGPAEC